MIVQGLTDKCNMQIEKLFILGSKILCIIIHVVQYEKLYV